MFTDIIKKDSLRCHLSSAKEENKFTFLEDGDSGDSGFKAETLSYDIAKD